MKPISTIRLLLSLTALLVLLSGCDKSEPSGSIEQTTHSQEQHQEQTETQVQDPSQEQPQEESPEETSLENEPILIAGVLDPDTCEPEKTLRTIPNVAAFLGRRFDVYQETYQRTTLLEEDRTAIPEYIDLLIREFDYEIVGSDHFDLDADDVFNGRFQNGSWEVCLGLSSTDTGRELNGRINGASCDLYLYGDSKELTVRFSDLFYPKDFGHRWSGHEGDRFRELTGQYVLDAFYQKDGRYYNESDGLLSVKHDEQNNGHGMATVLLDGEVHSASVYISEENYADYPHDDYEIEVTDFLPGATEEKIYLAVPKTVTGGEVYRLSDGFGWRGDSPLWVICCLEDGDYARSSEEPTPRFAINACTIRLLRWDNTAETDSLIYASIDLTYNLEPMTIEALISAPANSAETIAAQNAENKFHEDEAIILKQNETTQLDYHASAFVPNYETFKWSIVSGEASVTIDGPHNHCTVTGISPGEVIIKCVYSYGKDEPNVLTGNPENKNHTKSKLYYILVE